MRHFPLWTRQHKQSKIGPFILPFLSIIFFSYFGFHVFHGQYGIFAKYTLEEQIHTLEKKLHHITQKREMLEKRVRSLQDGSIEKDYLDEEARKALGFLRNDEIRIVVPNI